MHKCKNDAFGDGADSELSAKPAPPATTLPTKRRLRNTQPNRLDESATKRDRHNDLAALYRCDYLAGCGWYRDPEHYVGFGYRAHTRDRHSKGYRCNSARPLAAVPYRVLHYLPHWGDYRPCPRGDRCASLGDGRRLEHDCRPSRGDSRSGCLSGRRVVLRNLSGE